MQIVWGSNGDIFYLGGGKYTDISVWSSDYLADPAIQIQREKIKNEINIKTKAFLDSLVPWQKTSFSFSGAGYQYITEIYSFGGGNWHNYSVSCTAMMDNSCCVESICKINYTATDIFVDPIDINQHIIGQNIHL